MTSIGGQPTTTGTGIPSSAGRRPRKQREAWLLVSVLRPLIRRELRDAIRNRWFILYAIAFCVLAVGMAGLSQFGTRLAGLAGFGKTTASLVNLVLLIVPLMGLSIGAMNLAAERERGTLAYLLAQPVTRAEVFLAKFIGQGLAFIGAIAVGFGISAAIMAKTSGQSAGGADGTLFLQLAGLTALLALAMLAVGMTIATVVRRSNAALGTSIFVWLAIVFLSDLGLMGATIMFRLPVRQMVTVALFNPVQSFKLAAISGFDTTLDLLGPAGLYAVQTFGGWLMPLLIASLVAWIVVPLSVSCALFVRRPL